MGLSELLKNFGGTAYLDLVLVVGRAVGTTEDGGGSVNNCESSDKEPCWALLLQS